jgi:multidrug efflux pump subunit AcrA (membrane-fusion protein)
MTSVFIIFGVRRMKLAFLSVNFNVFFFRYPSKVPPLMLLALVLFCVLFNGAIAFAQSSGKPRATKVTVAKVTTETISDFSELQGRLVAGAMEAVTAVTTAKIEILDLQLGDLVSRGQHIAKQDPVNLVLRRAVLQAELAETIIQYDDMVAEIASESVLLEITEQRTTLLDRKAARAEDLVANNALPIDAAETARSNSLTAQENLLVQKSGLARKKAKLAIAAVKKDRLRTQINQLDADIAATTLQSRSNGLIIDLFRDKFGFAREGDVIARILDPSVFEVEVEVPVDQVAFLKDVQTINARTLDGYQLELAVRVILPVQNTRTATRTVRLQINAPPVDLIFANNAIVTVQIPTTGLSPMIVVPKDSVIPVADGHIVYLAVEGRAERQPIKLGAAVASGFIVQSGLSAGDVVVTRGNEQLSDGKIIEY